MTTDIVWTLVVGVALFRLLLWAVRQGACPDAELAPLPPLQHPAGCVCAGPHSD